MKNKNLILILLLLMFCSCIKLEAKPKMRTYVYINGAYGIIENGKVNRMGIPREDTYKMNEEVFKKYGIRFTHYYALRAPMDANWSKNNYIKFYNDMKLIINERNILFLKSK